MYPGLQGAGLREEVAMLRIDKTWLAAAAVAVGVPAFTALAEEQRWVHDPAINQEAARAVLTCIDETARRIETIERLEGKEANDELKDLMFDACMAGHGYRRADSPFADLFSDLIPQSAEPTR